MPPPGMRGHEGPPVGGSRAPLERGQFGEPKLAEKPSGGKEDKRQAFLDHVQKSFRATEKANETGKAEDHRAAAESRTQAAKLAREAGLHGVAAQHEDAAKQHSDASAKGGTPPEPGLAAKNRAFEKEYDESRARGKAHDAQRAATVGMPMEGRERQEYLKRSDEAAKEKLAEKPVGKKGGGKGGSLAQQRRQAAYGGESAEEVSAHAHDLSTKAHESNLPKDHEEARKAHEHAAKYMKQEGRHDESGEHARASQEHGKITSKLHAGTGEKASMEHTKAAAGVEPKGRRVPEWMKEGAGKRGGASSGYGAKELAKASGRGKGKDPIETFRETGKSGGDWKKGEKLKQFAEGGKGKRAPSAAPEGKGAGGEPAKLGKGHKVIGKHPEYGPVMKGPKGGTYVIIKGTKYYGKY
jgi:hypothetical protein